MYRQKWAAIVYGRSYHLDFRFIAIPEDFTNRELDWAAPYIVATTRKARKLPSHPRWSLFKNDSHCILGVTCMVRDLLGEADDDLSAMTKDDSGRPLYVFVGYVTQLERKKYLYDFPSYGGNCLEDFQSLYQYVRDVWWVKNFNRESRQPQRTDYQKLTFANQQAIKNFNFQLNHSTQHPDKVYLWQDSPEQNSQLWAASADFPQPNSVCLGINGKRHLPSPFLNQTLTELPEFSIEEKISIQLKQNSQGSSSVASDGSKKRSLSQLIAQKAKDDLNLTLQHAAQAATLGQELIDNFHNWSTNKEAIPTIKSSLMETQEPENFGFKNKSKIQPTTKTRDWF
jgi:hypothetical protein